MMDENVTLTNNKLPSNFFIIELLKDYDSPINDEIYKKGERLAAWYHKDLECYWVLHIMDAIPERIAKVVYKLRFEEVA